MTYRERRNVCEHMRALGFPRLISLENFRSPNFPLVAEILKWLVTRYEPNFDIPAEVDTEQDRVIFIRSVAQFMATKAHIKLNTKRLYQADGYAVKELLKISSILYDAIQSSPSGGWMSDDDDVTSSAALTYDVSTKIPELKKARQLASDITMKGASIYDKLAREVQLREIRSSVVSRQLEVVEVESGIQQALTDAEQSIPKTKTNIETMSTEITNYEQRIDKKKQELERSEKRLQTLKKVRPAFMDEFQSLEVELKSIYEVYLKKFRCLSYLEQQLEEYEKLEHDRMEERQLVTRQLLERLRDEEGMKLDTVGALVGSSDEDHNDGLGKRRPPRPGAGGSRRVFGSMMGEDEDTASLDSDSELLFEGGIGGDAGSDLGTDEELEVEIMAKRQQKTAVNKQHSDDDF